MKARKAKQRAQTIEVVAEPPATVPIPKLAYSMLEAAQALGVSYITIHRLIKRGELRASKQCRTKIIPTVELQRFLRESLL